MADAVGGAWQDKPGGQAAEKRSLEPIRRRRRRRRMLVREEATDKSEASDRQRKGEERLARKGSESEENETDVRLGESRVKF